MVNEDRLVALFKQLCLIDAPALKEVACAAFVRKHLEGMGLEVWEDDAGAQIGGNANNVIARLKGNTPGAPRVFFSAHLDTVEPTAGLVIGEKDGVFFSQSDTILGADDKAGMAPAIEAVQCLIENSLPHGDVYLLFSVAEEIGLKGADALKINDLNLDFGFVLDTGPPVGTFVTRTAYHDKIDFLVHGVPAHAGKDPEKGINALCVAADAVSRLKIGRVSPDTTSNLGIVSGGTAVNVVCPSVTIKGEARSLNLAELDQTIDEMKRQFTEAATRWGTTVDIDHKRHYDAYDLDPQSRVVQTAQRAAAKLGLAGTLRTTLGGSDANVYNAKGVPTIVLGTGMEKIHTHDEFVSRADLVKTAELAVELALQSAL